MHLIAAAVLGKGREPHVNSILLINVLTLMNMSFRAVKAGAAGAPSVTEGSIRIIKNSIYREVETQGQTRDNIGKLESWWRWQQVYW